MGGSVWAVKEKKKKIFFCIGVVCVLVVSLLCVVTSKKKYNISNWKNVFFRVCVVGEIMRKYIYGIDNGENQRNISFQKHVRINMFSFNRNHSLFCSFCFRWNFIFFFSCLSSSSSVK